MNALQSYIKLLPTVRQSPQKSIWLTYDQEADVMWINFQKPSVATDSELTDDDVIIQYAGGDIVGFTALHASQR
jgi:uncharacterized protein YuzE